MKPILPWSYSSLTSYENCPHRYYRERILEDIEKEDFKESSEGVKKHTEIELHLKGEQPLQDEKLLKVVNDTLADHGNATQFYEHKLAITKDRKPCDWEDPDAYHRGILDVLCLYDHPTAYIFDWKSGKVNHYSQQLKANAILVMAHHPHVQSVNTEYVWFKFNQTTAGKVFRDNCDKLWGKFIERVDDLEQAFVVGNWPKRQSGLCKNYCPVHDCNFNGKFNK